MSDAEPKFEPNATAAAAAELDAAAVVEAVDAVPEEVGVPVAEATALLDDVSAWEVTFLLPQTTDWQTD